MEIFPAVNLKSTIQGRVLCATTQEYQGPACPPDRSGAFLFINGRPIIHGLLLSGNQYYISLPILASATGLIYRYNKQTRIADLSGAPSPALLQASSPPPPSSGSSGSSGGQSQATSSGDSSDSRPLQAAVTSTYVDSSTYETRVAFTVTNTSKKPVSGITATLQYMDGYGKILTEKPFSIGTLGPGETATENDYWLNPMKIYAVKTNVKLDWAK